MAIATPLTESRDILPANVKPTHYVIELAPDLKAADCAGTVQIELETLEDSKEISLNTAEMKLLSAKITSKAAEFEAQESEDIRFATETQTTTITFKNSFKKGTNIVLTIDFQYTLGVVASGLYTADYTAFDGSKKIIASTQMEPVDARKAFPCFDEPALKATFDIILVVENKYTALSNMNLISQEAVGSDKKKITFATTPLMSTYLVAFVVGELSYIESTDFHVPVRVYADPGKVHKGKYALETAVKTLTLYEKTFGVGFPLPKMDMVVIQKFPGAMENWGLITYDESLLLLDEENDSVQNMKSVAIAVQHEIAHQWFGNLVTMDFWGGLWLNEGFATWISWYSSNLFYPDWKVGERIVATELAIALSLDSLRSSHPIEVPVKKAEDINQIFDDISYAKGAAVVHMISQYLGEEVFFEGIRIYMKKHAYSNTKTSDLWDALSIASGQDIAKVMSLWTSKVGYPIVKVTETADGIQLEQNRFLQTADVKPEEDETIYPIMTSLITSKDTAEDVQFTTRTLDIPLKSHEFFKLNKGSNGLYITLYSPERLLKLGEAIQTGLLGVEDRIGLVADASALAASGYQKTSALLGLLSTMGSETSTNVWMTVLASLTKVKEAFQFKSEATAEALRNFKRELTAPRAHQLGWEIAPREDILAVQNKVDMFAAAGTSNDEKCIEAAKQMYQGYYLDGDNTAMNSNFRNRALRIALEDGTEKEYDTMLEVFRKSTDANEVKSALMSLSYFTDPVLIKRTLAFSLTDEVNSGQLNYIFGPMAASPKTALYGWEFLKANWDAISVKLGEGMDSLGPMLSIVVAPLAREDLVEDINKFFAEKDTKNFNQKLEQSLDALAVKLDWVKRDGDDVENWLKLRGYMT